MFKVDLQCSYYFMHKYANRLSIQTIKIVYGPSSRPSVRDKFKVMYHNKTIRMYFIIIEKTTNSVQQVLSLFLHFYTRILLCFAFQPCQFLLPDFLFFLSCYCFRYFVVLFRDLYMNLRVSVYWYLYIILIEEYNAGYFCHHYLGSYPNVIDARPRFVAMLVMAMSVVGICLLLPLILTAEEFQHHW